MNVRQSASLVHLPHKRGQEPQIACQVCCMSSTRSPIQLQLQPRRALQREQHWRHNTAQTSLAAEMVHAEGAAAATTLLSHFQAKFCGRSSRSIYIRECRSASYNPEQLVSTVKLLEGLLVLLFLS
jgi:hypothetical protein